MRLTEEEDIMKLLAAEPNAIGFVSVDGKPILTASTKDLQAFVLKYADDDRLFSDEVSLIHPPSK